MITLLQGLSWNIWFFFVQTNHGLIVSCFPTFLVSARLFLSAWLIYFILRPPLLLFACWVHTLAFAHCVWKGLLFKKLIAKERLVFEAKCFPRRIFVADICVPFRFQSEFAGLWASMHSPSVRADLCQADLDMTEKSEEGIWKNCFHNLFSFNANPHCWKKYDSAILNKLTTRY